MLDFYLIADSESKPNAPGQRSLEFAGRLDDKTFDNLRRKNIVDTRFDYYSDFRWGTQMVQQMLQEISKRKIQSDTDVTELIRLLEIARERKCGLIAYGD
jgi:hypothetical protein